jgi:hypothetical protein
MGGAIEDATWIWLEIPFCSEEAHEADHTNSCR